MHWLLDFDPAEKILPPSQVESEVKMAIINI
jgi:hypothetical protein